MQNNGYEERDKIITLLTSHGYGFFSDVIRVGANGSFLQPKNPTLGRIKDGRVTISLDECSLDRLFEQHKLGRILYGEGIHPVFDVKENVADRLLEIYSKMVLETLGL